MRRPVLQWPNQSFQTFAFYNVRAFRDPDVLTMHMRQSAPLPVHNNAMNVAARVYRCQYLPMSVLQGTASRRDNTAVRTRHQCGWQRLPVKCNIQVA